MGGMQYLAAVGICICAAVVAINGASGWGWFLLVAVLVAAS